MNICGWAACFSFSESFTSALLLAKQKESDLSSYSLLTEFFSMPTSSVKQGLKLQLVFPIEACLQFIDMPS